ncbi:DUF748 domain-containing protein [bacterium]|nr:DUF748 domain-containing protein [bacterium]
MTDTWRARLHRWRWWLAAAAVLLVIRAALPEVLRRVIVSQASQALNARVDVGDVDLRLWRGGIALEDVAVREKGAPEPPPPAAEEEDEHAPPPPAFDAYSPIVGFKRLAVELRYLPLLRKTIQLRSITLDTPRVALDRLASGDLNLLALVPQQPVAVEAGAPPTAGATPAAVAAEGTPWAFGLDKFELTDGRVRFRDLALQGSEPVELGIARVSVDQIALTPAVYGKPGTIAVKLGVDEGTIDVTAHVTLDDSRVSVVTDVTAQSLPLRRARLYVPTVGWSDLQGALDLGLTYELVPEQTNALHGTVALRDVSVAVPSLSDVAVGWRSLELTLERIDLLAQRAAVRSVALDGATVAVRVEGGDLLPALAPRGAAPPTDTPAEPTAAETAAETPAAGEGGAVASPALAPSTDTPAPAAPEPTTTGAADTEGAASATPSPTPDEGAPGATESPPSESAPAAAASPAAPTPAASPWGWQVANVTITDSRLRVVGDLEPIDIGVGLDAASLTGDADAIGHLALAVAIASGTIDLAGDLRLAPLPAFGGTLRIAALPLPVLPVVRRILPSSAMPSGELRADLAIAAGLPSAAGGEAAADRVALSGTLGLANLRLAPPQVPDLALDLPDLELRLDHVAVPGVIPPGRPAAPGAAIELAAALTLRDPHVARGGAAPLDVAAQSIALAVPSLTVPAALARLGPGDAVVRVAGELGLDLERPRVAQGEAMGFEAAHVGLRISDASLPILATAAAADAVCGEAAGVAVHPPAALALQLDLVDPKLTSEQGRELNAGAQAIGLQLADVRLPGFVAGAPLAPSAEPLQAKATLSLTAPRLARGDGKELAISARSISVPLQSLSLPGVPGGIPPGAAVPPLRAAFGEIRVEAPAIRVTRTKEGIVLPAMGGGPPAGAAASPTAAPTPAAPAASPSAQPLAVQVAALRVLRGGIDFTDRAVQPPATLRFAPIEIEARDIALPGPQAKALKVDITALQQGRITVRGDLGPDASTLELKVDDLPLAPLNAYATTYSPYGIADGALTIDVKADAKGGNYTVQNDIRLHQFDLSGSEGDSLFEQNFGIPLSLALALLRDVQGNIDLSVPMQVDRQGNTQIDLMAVVRSALKQALAGAITSPLKMLGAVAGGAGAPIAPQPIAFRLGRAEPTGPGAESAARLAAFLASRPAMGVQLTCAATPEDARWLHEQALLASWADEGVFARSLAFVTERGPRQRIRAYLEARVADQKPELSAEDAATLAAWLQEIPPPPPDALQALAEARLAAVESVLREKGIDPSRISRGAPPEEATKPIVGINLRTAATAEAEEPDER